MNYLFAGRDGSIQGLGDDDARVDVNDDGGASAIDALAVINPIARHTRGDETFVGDEQVSDFAISELMDDDDAKIADSIDALFQARVATDRVVQFEKRR
jgi:hypothetical protein